MTHMVQTYYLLRVWDPEFVEKNGRWLVIANTETSNEGAVACYMGYRDDACFGPVEYHKNTEARGVVIIADSEQEAKRMWVYMRDAVNNPD